MNNFRDVNKFKIWGLILRLDRLIKIPFILYLQTKHIQTCLKVEILSFGKHEKWNNFQSLTDKTLSKNFQI